MPPSPAPGPIRDAMAEQAATRADRAGLAMTVAMDAVTDRIIGRVLAKLRSPRVRKGTRHWKPAQRWPVITGPETEHDTEDDAGPSREAKALDGGYVVPDGLLDGLADEVRPVMIRVARDAAVDVGDRLGGDDMASGMFAIDEDLVGALVDDALADLLGAAQRYISDVRQAVLDIDDTDMALDDVLDQVEQTARRRAGRIRTDARTMGTALAAVAEIEQARTLGVATMQWISRRDERVRHTHQIADGQQRALGEPFRVGAFLLGYPGDPSGLPATAGEVMGCRCGLLFARPDPATGAALVTIADAESAAARGDLDAAPGVGALLGAAYPDDELPPVGGLIELPEQMVGWRLLTLDTPDLVSGQAVTLAAGTELGLAAPSSPDAAAMSVLLPARLAVRVVGGTVVLAEAVATVVLAAGTGGVQLALM